MNRSDRDTIQITNTTIVGCLQNGFKRLGPCQDGLFYRVACDCDSVACKQARLSSEALKEQS